MRTFGITALALATIITLMTPAADALQDGSELTNIAISKRYEASAQQTIQPKTSRLQAIMSRLNPRHWFKKDEDPMTGPSATERKDALQSGTVPAPAAGEPAIPGAGMEHPNEHPTSMEGSMVPQSGSDTSASPAAPIPPVAEPAGESESLEPSGTEFVQ